METKEETKHIYDTKETDSWKRKAVDEYQAQIKIIHSVLSNSLLVEGSMLGLATGQDFCELIQPENIDLTKVFNGTIYTVKLEKMLDSKDIISKIDNWRKNLKCSSESCNSNATMTYIHENSAQIFCEVHSNMTEHLTKPHLFENEHTINKLALSNLEKQLMFVQERICFINSEAVIKNFNLYESKRADIDCMLDELRNSFKMLNRKINSIINDTFKTHKKTKSSVSYLTKSQDGAWTQRTMKNETEALTMQISKYQSLSFIQEECKKCNIICFEILMKIYEVLRNRHIENLIKVLINSNLNIELEEESKYVEELFIPDEIYGREFQLIDMSNQCNNLVKIFENNIQRKNNNVEIWKKNVKLLLESIDKAKPILQDKSNELENILKQIKKDKILKSLSLKDDQFYQSEFKNVEDFPSKLAQSREIYNRLGQYNYPQADYSRSVQILSRSTAKGNKRIYVGQFADKTNIRDGIGIMVWSNGAIYEGCWKDNKPNGIGRYIYGQGTTNGDYYIGEFKDSKMHGKGTYYFKDGGKYTGEYFNDKKNGQGTYCFDNGYKYIGEFKEDHLNGQGTLYTPNRTIVKSGKWNNSKYVDPK